MAKKGKKSSAPDAGDNQPQLIDVDHPAKAKIGGLVRSIKNADEDRSEAQEKGTKKREELAAVMREYKLTSFRIGEFVARLKPGKDKVSVRAEKDGDGAESGEGAGDGE